MSLINNILNELEKNKRGISDKQQLALTTMLPNIKKQKGLVSWKFFYLIIVLIIPFSVIWYFYPQQLTDMPNTLLSWKNKVVAGIGKATTTPQSKTDLQPLERQVEPVSPSSPQAVVLQNIVLEQKDNKTVLDFMLSGPISYSIEHGSEQQLFITLNNTGISGNLPISLENSFIISFNTTQNNNNIVSTLTLLPGTKIDVFQLVDKPAPHLHMVLSNPQITNATMEKTPSPLSPEEEAVHRYQEIKKLIAQNDNQSAIQKLHLFVGDFPNNNEVRSLLVSLLIKEGRLQKANAILIAGLEKYPDYNPFIKLKAHLLIQQNNTEAALDFLQKRLTTTTVNDAEYLALLAALYQQKGNFMLAAELYNQLTKIQPEKAIWWIGLGVALESADKKNAAKEAFDRARNSVDISPELKSFLDHKQ